MNKGHIKTSRLTTLVSHALFALILSHCGQSQTSDSDSAKIKKDVKVSDEISSGQATTLAIESGSASGSAVVVQDGSLPAGATLSLDRVDPPSEFTAIAGEEEEGDSGLLRTASSTIFVDSKQNDSTPTLSSPMTIAIPYAGTSLRLLPLASTKIEAKSSNLCVLHRTTIGELYVFRNRLLSIDSDNKKVTFKSKNFGYYQLVFCGNESLSDFADAGEKEITAPPPGAKEGSFSSFGKEISYSLTIDSGTFGYGLAKYCLLILNDLAASSSSASSQSTVIAAGEFAITGTTKVENKLTVDTSLIPDTASVTIAVLVQKNTETCSWQTGESLNSAMPYQRAMLFTTTKSALTSQSANGTLGTGAYALEAITFKTGVPATASSSVGTIDTEKVCLRGSAVDSKGNEISSSSANTSLSSTSSDYKLKMHIPTVGANGQKWEALVGKDCQDETAINYKESYTLKFKTPEDKTYYLSPIAFSMTTMNLNSTAKLALEQAGGKVCMELYDGNFTAIDNSPGITSDKLKLIGKWTVATTGTQNFYIPWDNTKMSAVHPLYDALLTPGSCGSSALTSFSYNDKSLIQ